MRGDAARILTAPGIRPTLGMLVLLTATLAVGTWGLLTGRREAQRAIHRDLVLRTHAEAGALEAALASLRGDLLFLTQATSVHDLPDLLADPDPVSRRWGRLDVEATLVRFLQSRPEIETVRIFRRHDEGERIEMVVTRRDGVPVVSDARAWTAPPETALQRGEWTVGEDPRYLLETFVSLPTLLRRSDPALSEDVRIHEAAPRAAAAAEPGDGNAAPTPGPLCAHAPVRDSSWTPPVARTLEMCAGGGSVLRAELEMAGRFRSTLGLNVGLALLSLLMGVVAYRQVRRGVAAEAARAHESRVRELERQVLHSERLASVGRLAAGIAHEVNNPLEGMSSYLTLLREDVSTGRTEDALSTVDRLREGIERVASVTRHVLAYSDPGRAPRRPLDLRAVVRETAEFLRAKPEFRDNEIDLQLPDTEMVVEGNAVTLGQVFLNLILNALEARPSGRVEVRGAHETLDAGATGGRAVVSVRDHGDGIAEESREKIFEPFYSDRGSTGLGLSVCFGIVQAHGGAIEAGNHPNGGAIMTVRLPIWKNGDPRE